MIPSFMGETMSKPQILCFVFKEVTMLQTYKTMNAGDKDIHIFKLKFKLIFFSQEYIV